MIAAITATTATATTATATTATATATATTATTATGAGAGASTAAATAAATTALGVQEFFVHGGEVGSCIGGSGIQMKCALKVTQGALEMTVVG